jgi:uncharacterized glyoxalase superfamily protein PhnB
MRQFYGGMLGLPVADTWEAPGYPGTVYALEGRGSDLLIEVLDVGSGSAAGDAPSSTQLMVQVEDVDTLYRQFVRSGARAAEGLANQPWGHRNFRVDDPDGFSIWFYQITAAPGNGEA